MADITMCATESCPLEIICYRKQAKPSELQSMALFKFTKTSLGAECENLIALKRKPSESDNKDA